MRNTKKTVRRTAVVGGTVAALIGGGVAFAYWTSTGTGTGSASTATSQPVTVTQEGSTGGLVPGGPAQPVNFTIKNPASFNQYVSTVTFSISSVEGGTDSAKDACTANDFTLVQPSAINSDLSNGDHTYSPSGASIALKNLATNQDNCKNATVNLAFSAE